MIRNQLLENIIRGGGKHIKHLFYNPYKKVGYNWFDIRKLKNLPDRTLHTIKFLGHSISFRSKTEFLHSVRELFIEEIYKQPFKDHPYIIDCGANIGLSVIYLKRLFPNAHIVAFEPDEMSFSLLQKNVSSFGLSSVELRKEAIWIENTTLSFLSEGSLSSKINETPTSNTIEVKATRLKDLLNRHVYFLKVDIEGAEYKVLKDIEEDLFKIENLFIEYHGSFKQNKELSEIFQLLTHKGFHFYIKEAIDKHPNPFVRVKSADYDVQINIFCFRNNVYP